MKRSSLAILLAFSALSAQSWAQVSSCQKSYAFQADVGATTGTLLCTSTAASFFDSVKNFNLSNSTYDGSAAVDVGAKFNDVNLRLWYPGIGAAFPLHFSAPELGISLVKFHGATRAESQAMFEDYIKKNNIIGQIMNYQAKNSPTSPITGVGGLIPMTIASDFDSNFTGSATAVAAPQSTSSGNNNLMGVGLNYGNYNVSQSADRVKTTTLPLSYTIRNDMDPRRQLNFSMPITMVDVGGAKTYHGGLGVSYRVPMSDHWTLTPGGRYSIVASKDRATLSTLYSASITSTYVMPHDGYDISIGNMLGYYRTGKFASGDYSFDPGIKNVATRNGVMLSQPFSGLGKRMTVEYSLIDTRYFGDKPFLSSFQEIGVTIGTSKSAQDARSYLRAGVSYMTGKSTNGFTLNLGYWF